MNYLKSYCNFSKIIITFLLSIFVVSMVLVGINNDTVVLVSKISTYLTIILLIVICYYVNIRNNNRIVFDKRLSLLFFFAIWLGFRADNLYGIGLFFQACVLAISALVFFNIKSYKLHSNLDSALITGGVIYVIIVLIHFLVAPIFTNTNYIGVCGLIFCIFFFSRKTVFYYILSFFCFLSIFASGTRSVLLGLIVTYFLYILSAKKIYIRILYIVLLSIIIFLFFKNGYYEYVNSDEFAQLIFEKTGKRPESGRIEIWNTIFSNMDFKDYIWGLGGGTSYEKILGRNLSAHSGYVYIMSSYGVIGLLLFGLLIFYSLIYLYNKGHVFSFFLFTALLFREFFEVTLVHNSFPIALFFWTFLFNGYLDKRS